MILDRGEPVDEARRPKLQFNFAGSCSAKAWRVIHGIANFPSLTLFTIDLHQQKVANYPITFIATVKHVLSSSSAP